MNKEESIMDDETIWFGYARGFCALPFGTPQEKAEAVDEMFKEHRQRFPKRIK